MRERLRLSRAVSANAPRPSRIRPRSCAGVAARRVRRRSGM